MEQLTEREQGPVEVPLDNLKNPCWMLRSIDQEVVSELERSIESIGLLQPIVVRNCGHDGYEIVFGNHRAEACRRLGLKYIRAIIKDFGEEDAFVARVSENLVRNDYVDPIEEAKGYDMLINRGWSINSIGRKVGKCDSYICERLAMLGRLEQNTVLKIRAGKLTPSHAELLSRIQDPARQNQLAELVVKNRLSVRMLENMVNNVPRPTIVPIENSNKEPCLRIPIEFLIAIAPSDDRPRRLLLRVRGRKLILENLAANRNQRDK